MVPPSTAMGTFFSGFSTASALAQADSRPRKAHSVIATEELAASKIDRPWGFQAAA
ncbi:hypothetical protein D3C78_1179720 [compost metagenome]